jgi:hypothetical protein
MDTKQLVQVAVFGILAGLLVWGLTYMLEVYVLKALMCPEANGVTCASASQLGEAIATIFTAAIGLFALVKLQVFRPLLVVIATVVSLWGIIGIVGELPMYMIGLSVAGLYAISYLMFTWITRLRLFSLVAVLLVVLIVLIRVILTF